MIGKTIIKCDECEHEFFLEAIKIENADVKLNNKLLTLTYFVCPKCNKIYRITIKDERCKLLEEDIERAKLKVQKICCSGNIAHAIFLDEMLQKKIKRFRIHIEKLNEMFKGTFILVVSENNCEEKNIEYLP